MWINVTNSDLRVLVNLANVTSVQEDRAGKAVLVFVSGKGMPVDEKYEDVLRMIEGRS